MLKQKGKKRLTSIIVNKSEKTKPWENKTKVDNFRKYFKIPKQKVWKNKWKSCNGETTLKNRIFEVLNATNRWP